MKSDVFGLELAIWPALLINEQGVIRAASQGAKGLFGPAVENGASLKTIWVQDEARPEQLFQIGKLSSSESQPFKLRARDGIVHSFNGYASEYPSEEKQIVLQFFTKGKTGTPPASAAHLDPLIQKQKLDCALQLTRTVALDFNNALTSILGHTSLLLSKLERNHPWRESLVEVEKSAEKAAEVAHDLAAFSRQEKETQSHSPGNLNDLLRRSVDFFRSQTSVEWDLDFAPKLYAAHFDEAKLQQAITKILENAVQAVAPRGNVTVQTGNLEVDDAYQDGAVRLNSGTYVRIEIKDTGSGITADALPRIFEPFFTTKANPPHRGLGLAWVYGIVTNHGGSVTVSSEVKKGTSVRVYLPAVKKFVKDRGFKTDDDLSGTQTILMIDDEDLLLTMGQMVLSSYGYKVITANSGSKGLDMFRERAGDIDLVITDLVMPQMSGREVMDRLRKMKPDLKIICSSGYMRSAGVEEDENYLQKPFTSQDLLRKVKQALAVPDGAA